MMTRIVVLALATAALQAQSTNVQPSQSELLDGPTLQAAQKANPDDPASTSMLLRYYGAADHDPDWKNRFAVLSWNIQHHPDAAFLNSLSNYQDMPSPLRDELKQMWTTQIHQHADNAQVLRNAAAALDTSPQLIRVGGNVQSHNILHMIRPAYPAEARQAGIVGTVRFNATIGLDGHIENLELVSGHPLLVAGALQAVQQWTYKPTLLNGNPVRVATVIDVNFTLNQ